MSDFWSIFIIVLIAVNLVGAIWILRATSVIGEDEGETTGHVWDEDLKEWNNPLPRWWLWLFYLTVIWGVAYILFYPGLGNYAGLLGWTQEGRMENEIAAAEERYGNVFAAFEELDLVDMARDPDALRLGRNLYMNNCATCHGSDARGALGFPNLTDNDWLYGGDPATVQASINNGRTGVMPALGAALGDEGVDQVVAFMLQINGDSSVDSAQAAAGQAKFVAFCSACHGAEGRGVPQVGGPDLTNGVWLHGGDEATLRDVIWSGRVNEMPAQKDLLSEQRIRAVTAYVLSLSQNGGE